MGHWYAGSDRRGDALGQGVTYVRGGICGDAMVRCAEGRRMLGTVELHTPSCVVGLIIRVLWLLTLSWSVGKNLNGTSGTGRRRIYALGRGGMGVVTAVGWRIQGGGIACSDEAWVVDG